MRLAHVIVKHIVLQGSLLAGHNAYAQLPVMTALKQLVNDAFKAVKKAPLVSDESKKWLEWSEFLGVVRRLRAECAGKGRRLSCLSSALSVCFVLVVPMQVCGDYTSCHEARHYISALYCHTAPIAIHQ